MMKIKIKIKPWHIILFLFLVIIFYLFFCFNFLAGRKGFSGSMKESKELGVYAGEYKIDKDSIHLINNNYLTFGEIWLEKYWSKGRHHWEEDIDEEYKKSLTLYLEIPEDKLNMLEYYLDSPIDSSISIKDTLGDFLGMLYSGKKIHLVIINDYDFFNKPIKLLVVTPDLKSKDIVIDSFYVIKK